jgi:hypothetical protein
MLKQNSVSRQLASVRPASYAWQMDISLHLLNIKAIAPAY